jgi:Ca2+-binding RTX toxin-like protein
MILFAGGYSQLYGDAGSMSGSTHGGDDALTASSGVSASLYGDANSMSDSAQGGNDTLTANAGTLVGDAYTMSGSTHGGDDILTVTSSGFLVGDALFLTGASQGGNDILNGGNGNDNLYGDAYSYSPSSLGSITGGTDTLNGGAGDDQLWGGPNDDKFVFNVGSGNDTIFDFNQGNLVVGSAEHDVIDVQAYFLIGASCSRRSAMSLGMP